MSYRPIDSVHDLVSELRMMRFEHGGRVFFSNFLDATRVHLMLPSLRDVNTVILCSLQVIHDSYPPSRWHELLIDVARDYGLSTAAIDEVSK